MTMKISLLQVGKTDEKYLAEGIDKYAARIKRYVGFDIITVPDIKNKRNMPREEQKNREGELILQHVTKDDILVLLDDKGMVFNTLDFAGWMEKMLAGQGKRMIFAIGGPWGFSDKVYAGAKYRLSLSRLTFSHQLVRLLFAEQLYRAFTVIKGEPYHHE